MKEALNGANNSKVITPATLAKVMSGSEWKDMPWATGWTHYTPGASYQRGQFKKVGNEVKLRGLAYKPGSGGNNTIAVLPDGFRPKKIQQCSITGQPNETGNPVMLTINPNGTVSIQYPSNVAAATWVSLHGAIIYLD